MKSRSAIIINKRTYHQFDNFSTKMKIRVFVRNFDRNSLSTFWALSEIPYTCEKPTNRLYRQSKQLIKTFQNRSSKCVEFNLIRDHYTRAKFAY